MNSFQLHPRLEQDCLFVEKWPLSMLLLMNDSQYPWFILVPQRCDISEIYQLNTEDRQQLMLESCWLAEALVDIYQPDKLNIANIGNLVPQLHVHHVARFQTDVAWPAPIWGKFPANKYPEQEAQFQIQRMRGRLQDKLSL